METLTTLPLMERIMFLSGVPLFSTLAPADLKQVAAVAKEHLFPDGAVLAKQGQPGEELYIVVSGAVRVLHEERQIALRERGQHVGEQAILTGAARNATLVAAGETRTLVVDRPHFESILRERPETALAVIRTLSERLTELL
jgi:CRP-like cAMP-binding protein